VVQGTFANPPRELPADVDAVRRAVAQFIGG
jgi:hypothetical protein